MGQRGPLHGRGLAYPEFDHPLFARWLCGTDYRYVCHLPRREGSEPVEATAWHGRRPGAAFASTSIPWICLTFGDR
jgi:hypothetical protein